MAKLYQLDTKGNTKVWIIEVIDQGQYSELIVRSGRQDGRLMENIAKISSGKNIGRSNETTHFSQAELQMESKIQSKLKKGYVYNITEAKSSAILGSGIPAPMLAQKYSFDGSQKGSKTLEQLNLIGREIIVQPKLDGNRCLIKIENGVPQMHTRKGILMPVQLSHILDDLQNGNLEENTILDGELFSEEFSFNILNGLIKREKVTEEDLEQRKLIKYHLYDVMIDEGYEIRYGVIKQFESQNIVIVPSKKIVATDKNIEKELGIFLSEGHEGLMIRQLSMGYDNKRSWQLCKVKVFEDAEFKLIDFVEDVRGGFAGSFVMQDNDGNIFNAGASGQNVEQRTEMWNNRGIYIGKMATVEFFGLSEYGIPRFPKFKGIRE